MEATPVLTLSREQMRSRALAFAQKWQGAQREEAEAKTFLDQFFDIFGRDRHAIEARHEYRIDREGQSQGRIDLLWPGKLLVEMKSTGKDLSDQPGGAARQAFDYLPNLDAEDYPRWILVSDFARFLLYDLGEKIHDYLHGLAPAATGHRKPELFAQFTLDQLPERLACFGFIRGDESEAFQPQPEVNLKAVRLLGSLHDELKKSGFAGHDLECFLVRLLFCLFAEDTDIFPWNSFTRFVENGKRDGTDLGNRLGQLFRVLNTDILQRSPHLTADFRLFPYVNGGLFKEFLPAPDTAAPHRSALLACCRFDWSRISPGVFGSLFQGVMEPAERRAKGAHYTSEENIRKVIDPLFLDDLRAEFDKLRGAGAARQKRLEQFHAKLASLRFLDPACGCGNFLVVAYRELRALELEVLKAIYGKQLSLHVEVGDIARVNVDQFYGIELEEFPARIAETALWLTDHQANLAFSKAFGRLYTRIPLKKSPAIRHGNALRLDWKDLLPSKDCSYLLGNPPFVGKHYQKPEQKADMALVFGDFANVGDLDYVTSWFVKAADYTKRTSVRCAFVATNSITQGEQVPVIWGLLLQKYGIQIHFAHRTFTWSNEASGKAHVHCVIIGFSHEAISRKRLYDSTGDGPSRCLETDNISPYLTAGPSLFVSKQRQPLGAVPEMRCGCKPSDGGNLLLDAKERNHLLSVEPEAKALLRRFVGSDDLINGIDRWCLWLEDVSPSAFRHLPEVRQRVEAVRQFRLKSSAAPTRKAADTPTLFFFSNAPKESYIAVPEVSSERRRYIPVAIIPASVIPSNKLYIIPSKDHYLFGILSSAMHMAWAHIVSGRLESRFQYSASMVYNTFPWPEAASEKQKEVIRQGAQNILHLRVEHGDGRLGYLETRSAGMPHATLADLYDPLTMPPALLKAHEALDRAVDRAYRKEPFTGERERVDYLFALYEKLTSPLALGQTADRTRRKSEVTVRACRSENSEFFDTGFSVKKNRG